MKKILVVVDYQNDFVNGALGSESAELIEDAICEKIRSYSDSEVVYTLDTHGSDYLDTHEGKNLPVPHCIKGTEGHKLYGKTAGLLKGKRCFEKPSFGSLELCEYLKKGGYDVVEICGLVTDICVLSNAVMARAALPEAEIIVDSSCTASASEQNKENALNAMKCVHITVL